MPNFRLLSSIIKKKYLKVVDPLKKSRLLFFGCFDLESSRIKLSRPCMNIKKERSLVILMEKCQNVTLEENSRLRGF